MTEEYLTDDEQLEVIKHAMTQHAPWLIGGALLGAALFFGYRYYGNYSNEQALKAAAQFDAMTQALQANDYARSQQIADGLIKDYAKSPYADQARLSIAKLYVEEAHTEGAIAPLTQVMNESKDTELRRIARLRLARVLTDQGKPDEAIKLLAEGTAGTFAARYHEVRGDAFAAKKNFADAVNEYTEALNAAEASGINAALLELKMQDLGVAAAPSLAGAPSMSATAPEAATKVAP